MELPILKQNSNTTRHILSIQYDLSKLVTAAVGDDNRISQEVAIHTLDIIQDSIQLLKHLENNGYDIEQDIQQHNFKLRNFDKAGKIELRAVED